MFSTLLGRVRRARTQTFDPFQAVMYQQGQFWGMCGNGIDNPLSEPYNHPQFVQGWQDARKNIHPVFAPNVATIALHRSL